MAFAENAGMQEMRASAAAGQFVKGLDYPITKAEIVSAAHEASLDPTVQDALKKLPDRDYVDAEDLTVELSAS